MQLCLGRNKQISGKSNYSFYIIFVMVVHVGSYHIGMYLSISHASH